MKNYSMQQKTQIFIGFDYGQKSIGIAVGQTVTRTAKALTALKAHQGEPHWAQIESLIQTWQPNGLVVGIPLNMDGTEQNTTKTARQFAEKLRQKFNITVHEIDERLTTRDARDQLFNQKGYQSLTKSAVDALSAKLILENFMSQLK